MPKVNYFDIITQDSDKVFQVDKECYLIYLGSDFLEVRPYLRIGNCPNLDKFFIPHISHIILSEKLIGNLHYEKDCLDPSKNVTIYGSQKQLNIYFRFLEDHGHKTENMERQILNFGKQKEYSHVIKFDEHEAKIKSEYHAVKHYEDDPRKKKYRESQRDKPINISEEASLFFDYHGNFRVQIGKDLIFDLQKRLSEDINDNSFNNDLYQRFIHTGRNFFKERGFIYLDGPLAYYEKGSFILSDLPDDYYKELLKANINPDTLNSVITSRGDLNYENFLKRQLYIGNKPAIFCRRQDELKAFHDFYPAQDISLKSLSNKPYVLGDTRMSFHADAGCIRYDVPDIECMVDFHLSSAMIERGEKIIPEYQQADIHIIPQGSIGKVRDNNNMFLVYETGAKRNNSYFKAPVSCYKLFPYIDYRFSRHFRFNTRLYYPLDVYLKQVEHAHLRIINGEYSRFMRLVVDLIDSYIQKSIEFRTYIKQILNRSRRLMPPRNRFEYFLLHNSIEFIRYIKNVLELRAVLKLDVFETAITELVNLRDRSAGIEIGDFNIKGNINTFPNGEKYLFYSTDEKVDDMEISRQHTVYLQKNIEDDPYILENDHNRSTEAVNSFIREFQAAEMKTQYQEKFRQEYIYFDNIQNFFQSEKRRFVDLQSFIENFRTLGYSEQKTYYQLIKSVKSGLDEYEKDEALFGDLLTSFSFSQKRVKFKSRFEKQSRRKTIGKFAFFSLFMIIFLCLAFINIPLFKKFYPTREIRRSLMDMGLFRSMYLVDDVKRFTSWRKYLYKEEIPDDLTLFISEVTTNYGVVITNKAINPAIFNRPLNVSYEDFNRYFDEVIGNNDFSGDKKPELIFPGSSITLDTEYRYRVKKDDNLWSITYGEIKDRQKHYMRLLTRYHLVLSYYEQCLGTGRSAEWKRGKLGKVEVISHNIDHINDNALSEVTATYGRKLKSKANNIKKLLTE